MEYSIEPSADFRYVIVDVTGGHATRSSLAKTTAAFLAVGAELGIRCYLVDMRGCRNVESAIENVHYTLDDVAAVPAVDLGVRVAVLVDPDDHSHDFAIAFGQLQGRSIAGFWDRTEAVEYLLEAADELNEPGRSGAG